MSKRLQKEYKKICKEAEGDDCNFQVELAGDDIHSWDLILMGPAGTPYEGGIFNVKLKFPAEYPFKAPEVKFVTKTYSPHLSDEGEICADLLKDWSPTMNAKKVIQIVRSLLVDPSSDTPVNAKVGREYAEDRAQFEKTCKEWVAKYAQ